MTWERWRRIPEAGACDFCLTLATRGAVYKSKMTAAGRRYHVHCRCTAGAEGKFNRRTDVAIPPEDADRIITMRTNPHGTRTYTYQYDLSKFTTRRPPRAPRPAPTTPPVSGTAVDLAAGALTQARLTSVRLQLAQLRDRLPSATESARGFITGRIEELSAEEIALSIALG